MKKAFILLLFLGFPLVMQGLDQNFYIAFATRVLIYAMAAASLNLVLGYGGMVSFGHAAFFGAGAYVVGILSFEGVRNLWIAWPAAILVAALAAFVIGALSLRTPSTARMPTTKAPPPKKAAWPKLTMPP